MTASLAAFASVPLVEYRVTDGVRIGLVSGIGLAAVLLVLDYWSRKKIVDRYGVPIAWGAYHEKNVRVRSGSPSLACAHIEAGMATLDWIYPESVRREGHTVHAVTKPTMSSFSENVRISVSDPTREGVSITIVSSPRSVGTLVDYGKAIQNVEELRRAILLWTGLGDNA